MSIMLKVGQNALLNAKSEVVLVLLDLPQLGWERLRAIEGQDGFATLTIGEGSSRLDGEFSITCTVDKILAIFTADQDTSERFIGR
jgi:hypothetical protein